MGHSEELAVQEQPATVTDSPDAQNTREVQSEDIQAVRMALCDLCVRHEQTVGLIGAKKTGGDGATGDILVFLDCHVAPQKERIFPICRFLDYTARGLELCWLLHDEDWHLDFLQLIAQNYRRMVVPQITALDIDTWTQIGAGNGGSSKCYVTWDGDFKWGGRLD
eukprot:2786989-Amphidinium_carterae.1